MGSKTGKKAMLRVDVTPTTEMLHSYRNSNLTAALCFGELIDNAIDADATLIEIEIDPRTKGDGLVRVSDNGNGMPNAAKAFQPGRHVSSGRDQGSSRYGIGLKDAAFRLGERVEIVSVRDGKRTRAVADVSRMMRVRRWEVLLSRRPASSPARGTSVTISRVDFQINPTNVSRLKTELEKIYATALRAGRTMTVNGICLEPSQPPKLRGERMFEGSIDGKKFRVRGGFLVSGQQNVSTGVAIRLPYRVICSGERIGFEKFDISDFWAEVELIESRSDRSTWWRVTKNKDSLHEKADICRAVADGFCDVLKRYTPNHVITIPIPKAPASEEEELAESSDGETPVEPGGGDVPSRGEGTSDGNGGDCCGVASVDENGTAAAKQRKRRGYELNVKLEPGRTEVVVEARVGEKSATVLLGDESTVFLNYTEGRDGGALRDVVALFAVACGLVLRHDDDPKTPLDPLISNSPKQTDRVIKTMDNLISQWNHKKR